MAKEIEWQTHSRRINARLAAQQPAWKISPYHGGLDTGKFHALL